MDRYVEAGQGKRTDAESIHSFDHSAFAHLPFDKGRGPGEATAEGR